MKEIFLLQNHLRIRLKPELDLIHACAFAGLSEEKAEYFADQWKSNLVSLSRSALGQTLMVNQLVDMEWKFGGKV